MCNHEILLGIGQLYLGLEEIVFGHHAHFIEVFGNLALCLQLGNGLLGYFLELFFLQDLEVCGFDVKDKVLTSFLFDKLRDIKA